MSNPRLRANYNSYHQMAVAGVPPRAIEEAFEEGDLVNVQEMAVSEYWKHVRSLLRKVPVFQGKLDFMADHFGRPVEQILEDIMDANFPQVTIAVTQMNHNLLRQWINELHKLAMDQSETKRVRNFGDGGVADADVLQMGEYLDTKERARRARNWKQSAVRQQEPPFGPDLGPDQHGFDELDERLRMHHQMQEDMVDEADEIYHRQVLRAKDRYGVKDSDREW